MTYEAAIAVRTDSWKNGRKRAFNSAFAEKNCLTYEDAIAMRQCKLPVVYLNYCFCCFSQVMCFPVWKVLSLFGSLRLWKELDLLKHSLSWGELNFRCYFAWFWLFCLVYLHVHVVYNFFATFHKRYYLVCGDFWLISC